MDKRQAHIEEAVKEELKSANEKFGDTFVSSHEAYAVLLEEIEEAKEDIEKINGRKDVYWYAVKSGSKEMQANELNENGNYETICVYAWQPIEPYRPREES